MIPEGIQQVINRRMSEERAKHQKKMKRATSKASKKSTSSVDVLFQDPLVIDSGFGPKATMSFLIARMFEAEKTMHRCVSEYFVNLVPIIKIVTSDANTNSHLHTPYILVSLPVEGTFTKAIHHVFIFDRPMVAQQVNTKREGVQTIYRPVIEALDATMQTDIFKRLGLDINNIEQGEYIYTGTTIVPDDLDIASEFSNIFGHVLNMMFKYLGQIRRDVAIQNVLTDSVKKKKKNKKK